MPFQKGNTLGRGRPPGRKGKLKKLSEQEWLKPFIENDQELAEKDFLKLTPYQRWRIRSDIYGYRYAKLRSIEIEGTMNVSDERAEVFLTDLKKTLLYEKYKDRLTDE